MGKTALNAILTAQANNEQAKTKRYDELWNDYMDAYGSNGSGLKNLLDSKNASLDDAFNTYFNSMTGNTGAYTGAMSGLRDKLNAPESKVTFGLAGFDPITSTKASARNDVSSLMDIAGKIYGADSTLAGEKYNYGQTKANSIMDLYNAMQTAAQGAQGGDLSSVAGTYLSANPGMTKTRTQRAVENVNSGLDLFKNLFGSSSSTTDASGTKTTSQSGSVEELLKMVKAAAMAMGGGA